MILHSPLESRTPHVKVCCDRARRVHVRAGMPVAEAQTLVRQGWFDVHDPVTDREQLRKLAWQCQRFTPCAGLEPAEEPETLFLDVTGCVPHFGDVEPLCRQVAECFEQVGYRVRMAVAPTLGAAWALAHFAPGRRPDRRSPPQAIAAIISVEELRDRFARLPLQALRLPMERISLLYECGLQTIGQLLELPRASLPSRFGPELLLRLDQAFGTAEELLEPDLPPVPIRQQLKFEYPLTEPDEVLQVLRQLLKEVLDQLTARRRETQQVTCGWGTEASDAGTFDIRMLRPTIQFERLWELLTLKLETMQLAAGLMTLWLEAVPCSPQSPRRTTLFEEEGPGSAEFLRLVERLSSRLGEQAVIRYSRIAESQPELSCVAEPWLSSTQESISDEVPTRAVVPRRPLRLLASPVRLRVMTRSSREGLLQFRWQDREYKVAQLHGPERIVTGWWRTGMIRRDYYRVETTTGARFWLFRECQSGHWFLQGVFE